MADDQQSRGYYYDDSHGYEDYRPTVLTIGHSTRDFDEFVGLLRENDIELLADVRSFPGSRKFPQFNKESLEVTLPENGIDYSHLRQLGGRRKVKTDSKNTVWRNDGFRGYADHMETEDFRKGIDELLELAEDKRTAIMCSEAVWWRCHRSMISDYLKSRGITVLHIMGEGKVEEHPYTSAAKIVDGRLSYEA
ncbi:MAG: DUF488 domain-containing protein [Acidobacteria bacterium]|nr:DUF488 domain-containing protein [Acidobacteriota bacterium]